MTICTDLVCIILRDKFLMLSVFVCMGPFCAKKRDILGSWLYAPVVVVGLAIDK